MIAGFQPESKFRQNAEIAVQNMNITNLPLEKHAGKILHACVTGDNQDEYSYMVKFPVKLNRENAGV